MKEQQKVSFHYAEFVCMYCKALIENIYWTPGVTDRGISFDEAENVLLEADRDILVERSGSADVMHFAKYNVIYSKF